MHLEEFFCFIYSLKASLETEALRYFRRPLEVHNKGDVERFDPVTAADRNIENVLRGAIQHKFPTHGIIGEEYPPHQIEAEYVWVLDPIDGTRAYLSGLPLWGILIALSQEGKPFLGAVVQPFLQEYFLGDGEKSWYIDFKESLPNFRPSSDVFLEFLEKSYLKSGDRIDKAEFRAVSQVLQVRSCAKLQEAILSTTHPRLFSKDKLESFRRIEQETLYSSYGGDCYAYCMLAAGQIDLIVESGLKWYDMAALIPLIRGAGGIVTDWRGKDPLASKAGDLVACGDKRVHEAALDLIIGIG